MMQRHLKYFYFQCNIFKSIKRFGSQKPSIILGIESSCDDTGCGIVDTNGNVLGEALHSQHLLHLKHGGIIPTIAGEMHRQHVTEVCENALRSANLRLRDIDAIATTIKPGLPLSLKIGKRFGQYLAIRGNKPFIPIHHMQAHALTVRITEKVDFPYLVLLISGGHCMLVLVQSVNEFIMLGTSLHNAPGEILDKVARKLKLNNIPEFSGMNGGQAIETAACKATNIDQFLFGDIMETRPDCQFSFSGLLAACTKHIQRQEKEYNITADMTIPDVYNLCAGFQLSITKHLCYKTQRAIEFLNHINVIPANQRTLVMSGGVACNDFIARALNIVCSELDYKLVRTPPKLCTDNGIMIAWNGAEKWMTGTGVIRNKNEIENVTTEKRAPIGEDWTDKIKCARLKCKRIKIEQKISMNNKELPTVVPKNIAKDAITISSNCTT